MKKLALTGPARREMRSLLQESAEQFGLRTAKAYRDLLRAAFKDLQRDPDRQGVRPSGGRPDVCVYHLRHSRRRAGLDSRIAKPRHLVAFRVVGETVEILRVLHDAMDIPARLGDDA